jgi:hypothetical protein
LYKRGWGVDRVDQEFIDSHGEQFQSEEVRLLLRMYYPSLYRPAEDHPEYMTLVKKACLVNEVVHALGFSSVFDTAHSFTEDLEKVYNRVLKGTKMFSEYRQTLRLFSEDAIVPKKWDSLHVVNALHMVMASCGITLHKQRHRQTIDKKKVSLPSTYSMENTDVRKMVQLLWLKTRRSGGVASINQGVTEVMRHVELDDEYRRCVDPRWDDHTWRGGDGRVAPEAQ